MARNPRCLRLLLVALGLSVLLLAGCDLFQPPPVADFTLSPVVLYAGEAFQLDGAPSAGPVPLLSYRWTLSDGQSLVGQQVTATIQFPGTYVVTLQVEDADGRIDLAERTVVVYARSGTVILNETFADGELALARWVLDPTWASADDARIDTIVGTPGNALYIHSAASRWHRRYHAVELPPLRVGQRAVISCRIMTLRNQDFHTYVFAPGRTSIDSVVGALPWFEFTNERDGAYVHTSSNLGTDIAHPIAYEPDVYRWHTYTFVLELDRFEFRIDDELWLDGPLDAPLSDTSMWSIVVGEESLTETCNAYYDDIRVTIEE